VRFVVIGAGAIGGVVGARLSQAGQEVVLVARGAHYEAIAAAGLTLETPREQVTLPLPVAPAPEAVRLTPEDVVLLAIKSQDTAAALQKLRRAAPAGTPVVCLQNGVENERAALRLFDRVYGAVVMAPTAHLEPGIVLAYGAAMTGQIDVGRYPKGLDDRCHELCEVLEAARFQSEPQPDIMRHKYAKLLLNLGNSVQAICGEDPGAEALMDRAQEEGRSVLRAAGIEFESEGVADLRGRWESWQVQDIEGRKRGGGSTWQSVVRGAGSVETDYLNGEIVLRGRLVGVPTPVNALLQSLAQQTALGGRQPGWLPAEQILAEL
jgi:2-dehydropantoate 2-reductase